MYRFSYEVSYELVIHLWQILDGDGRSSYNINVSQVKVTTLMEQSFRIFLDFAHFLAQEFSAVSYFWYKQEILG